MKSPSERLLVTGSAGFLGSRIVHFAREAGWQVRGFDRNVRTEVRGVETVIGDIADTAKLRKACEGMSAIVHAAGLAHVFGRESKNPAPFNVVNDEGTRCLVEAGLACGVPHVVLVSSVSVYGDYSGAICDETVPCQPQGPYAISKWRGEVRAIERMGMGPGSLTILRFATIYGEGDRGNIVKLIGALDRGRFIWPGSGNNQKSVIYLEDAARACVLALDRARPGVEVFNVSAQAATMREIVAAICQALGRPVPRLEVPLSLLNTVGAICRRVGDPGHLNQRLKKFIHNDVYAGDKFETAFGFRPMFTLSEGMRREVDSLHPPSRT